jgi:hypothetical protein
MQGPRSTLFAASAWKFRHLDARRVAKSESVAKCDYSDRSMLWNSCESASKYRTREFENENNGGKAPVAAANVTLRSIN